MYEEEGAPCRLLFPPQRFPVALRFPSPDLARDIRRIFPAFSAEKPHLAIDVYRAASIAAVRADKLEEAASLLLKNASARCPPSLPALCFRPAQLPHPVRLNTSISSGPPPSPSRAGAIGFNSSLRRRARRPRPTHPSADATSLRSLRTSTPRIQFRSADPVGQSVAADACTYYYLDATTLCGGARLLFEAPAICSASDPLPVWKGTCAHRRLLIRGLTG